MVNFKTIKLVASSAFVGLFDVLLLLSTPYFS